MKDAGAAAAAALLALASAAGTACAGDLRLSFANGTDLLVDSVFMECDAGGGSTSQMGGEMLLPPGRTGSQSTNGERISTVSFGAGARRLDFSLSAPAGNELAVRLCLNADGTPELHALPGRTAPSSCDGKGETLVEGTVHAPLDDVAEQPAVPMDTLLALSSPTPPEPFPFVRGTGPLHDGVLFLRGEAAGRPLAVRMEIRESMLDGPQLQKTVLDGASEDAGAVLGRLRDLGFLPVLVQLKSGDSQDDVEHRTFFDDEDASGAWEYLSAMLREVRELDDIPSATCLFIAGPDRRKALGPSPDITVVRGDFPRASGFRLAVLPHAGSLITAVR